MLVRKVCLYPFLSTLFLLNTPKGCISNQWLTMAYHWKILLGKFVIISREMFSILPLLLEKKVFYTLSLVNFTQYPGCSSQMYKWPPYTFSFSLSLDAISHFLLSEFHYHLHVLPTFHIQYVTNWAHLPLSCFPSCVLYFCFNNHHFLWHKNPGFISDFSLYKFIQSSVSHYEFLTSVLHSSFLTLFVCLFVCTYPVSFNQTIVF